MSPGVDPHQGLERVSVPVSDWREACQKALADGERFCGAFAGGPDSGRRWRALFARARDHSHRRRNGTSGRPTTSTACDSAVTSRCAVRQDVAGQDLIFLVSAAGALAAIPFPGLREDLWKRYLGVILDGLRPEGATRLRTGAPSRRLIELAEVAEDSAD